MQSIHGEYLGETEVAAADTPYENFTPIDWALEYIGCYGQIDGGHHKTWVLDQAARILKGTPVLIRLAKWADGHEEYRYNLQKPPSQEYLDWVEEQKGEYDTETDTYEYHYDEGCAP